MKRTEITFYSTPEEEISPESFIGLMTSLAQAAELLEKEMDGRGLLQTGSMLKWSLRVGEVTTQRGLGTLYWSFLAREEAAIDLFFHESAQMSLNGEDWGYPASSPMIKELADLLVERRASNKTE